MGILNRLHGAIRIGESLLATRRFSNSNVERMVLARKHLEVKLWFLKHCGGPLAAIAEEMLGATSRFQETFRLKREIKRKNATRSMSGMLDRMRVEADSEMFVDSLLRSLNVVSIVPNYPPKNFHRFATPLIRSPDKMLRVSLCATCMRVCHQFAKPVVGRRRIEFV